MTQVNDPASEGGFFSHFMEAVAAGVALIIRQSSQIQVENNKGSRLAQMAQVSHLEPFGVKPEAVRVFGGETAESARGHKARPDLERLIAAVEAGELRVVIVSRADRFSRGDENIERLYDALKAVAGFVVRNGAIHDMTSSTDRMILGILDQLAKWENESRINLFLASKAAVAKKRQLRIKLPRGLAWAPAGNPKFRAMAERAGLQDELTEESLAKHAARSSRENQEHYVLPFPDPDVVTALRLLREWALETRDYAAVAERIMARPDWPRPGEFIAETPRIWTPDAVATWKPVGPQESPDSPDLVAMLRSWFSSPAVYGEYAWTPSRETRRELPPDLREGVSAPCAFPGVLPPWARDELAEAASVRSWSRGDAAVPKEEREYLLPRARCGHRFEDGSVCGHTMYPSIRDERSAVVYTAPVCSTKGHSSSFPRSVEKVALSLVREAYSPSELTTVLREIVVDAGAREQRVKRIQARVDRAQRDLSVANEAYAKARASGEQVMADSWWDRARGLSRAVGQLKAELERERTEANESNAASEEELNALKRIAHDLPQLLEQLRDAPREFRKLMAVLVEEVRIARLYDGVAWVEIQLPGGARRGRLAITRRYRVREEEAQSVGVLLGRSPDEVQTLADAGELLRRALTVADSVEASPARVIACARRYDDSTCGLEHPCEGETTIEAVAIDFNLDVAALKGRVANGDIQAGTTPSDELHRQIHQHFPESARVHVARSAGRDPENLVPIADLAQRFGVQRSRIRAKARSLGALWFDASGRAWTDPTRSPVLMEAGNTSRTLEDYPPPEGARRGDGRWVALADAASELGNHKHTIRKHAHAAKPGYGYQGPRSVFVWIDDELRRKLPD